MCWGWECWGRGGGDKGVRVEGVGDGGVGGAGGVGVEGVGDGVLGSEG